MLRSERLRDCLAVEEEFSNHVMDTKYFAQGHDLPYDAIPEGPAPTSYDWRDHGAVTAVKNQVSDISSRNGRGQIVVSCSWQYVPVSFINGILGPSW